MLLIRYIRLRLLYRLIGSQDLSLLSLTSTHNLASHHHLPLSIGRSWLTLIFLLLAFKDQLLLLDAQLLLLLR